MRAEEFLTLFITSVNKDWLVILASLAAILALLEMRRLRKVLTQEINKKILPQLSLEIDEKNLVMYLKNDSPYLAQNIQIDEIPLVLDDFGFDLGITIRFNEIAFLKPNEKAELGLKAYDNKDNSLMGNLTERLVSHIMSAVFKVKVYFSNIENYRFSMLFNKEREKFFIEKIEYLP